jgi:hypothetical protein
MKLVTQGNLRIATDYIIRCNECGRSGVSIMGYHGEAVPAGVWVDLCQSCTNTRFAYLNEHKKPKLFKQASNLLIFWRWICRE